MIRCRNIVSLVFAVTFCFLSWQSSYAESVSDQNWFLANIHTPEHIKPATLKKKIVIAIVDDGVRITHQDLQKFIWTNPGEISDNHIDDDGNGYVDDVHGWDAADNDNSVMPPEERLKDFYHGTHLAGIVAQIARTAYGDAASDFIRIMPVKSLSDRAGETYLKDGYKGIEYAIRAGADIIVCAWGAGHISAQEAKILEEAEKRGVLVVASAGNFPEEKEQFPAAFASVLAVAALDKQNNKIERSNYGPFVGLSAPGLEIASASVFSDTGYKMDDGTSSSAAIVAGAAALVMLQHPSYTLSKVKACLQGSADTLDVTDVQYSAKLGAGKLNVKAAVECPLFSQTTPHENTLRNPQGYLYLNKPKGRSVSWSIKPQGVFKGIRLHLVSGNRRSGQGTMKFYSGDPADAAKLVAAYTLSALPDSIYIAGTAAYVTYESKKAGNKLDLLLNYKAEPINFSRLYCRDTVYLTREGTFEDGSGPNDYSPKTDCKWLITAPEGKVIQIKFTEFDTEAKTDLLYFFNGTGTHEKIMAVFSGPNIPPEITTWQNKVLVWFVTDGKNQGKGWKAEYRFKDP